MAMCSPHGQLGFVRVRKPEVRDALLARLPRLEGRTLLAWYALVEFATPEQAAAAAEALEDTGGWSVGGGEGKLMLRGRVCGERGELAGRPLLFLPFPSPSTSKKPLHLKKKSP